MSTRDDVIGILRDASVVTVTALVEYVEAQRVDERERIIAEVRRYRMKPQADLAGAEALRDDIADWLTPVEPIGAWTMAQEAEVRERIAEQVTTLAPDESGRISKGLALAYILGELDAAIAREDCTDGTQVKEAP